MPNEKKQYINRLFILRKRFGLSQDEVCKKLNIAISTLHRYEIGGGPIPSDKLIEFARIYKCSTDHILCLDNTVAEAEDDTSNN